jgi:hypothetical protein
MKFRELIEGQLQEKSLDKKIESAMNKLIIKMKKEKKKTSDILKALEVNFPSYDTESFYADFKNELVELEEASGYGKAKKSAAANNIIAFGKILDSLDDNQINQLKKELDAVYKEVQKHQKSLLKVVDMNESTTLDEVIGKRGKPDPFASKEENDFAYAYTIDDLDTMKKLYNNGLNYKFKVHNSVYSPKTIINQAMKKAKNKLEEARADYKNQISGSHKVKATVCYIDPMTRQRKCEDIFFKSKMDALGFKDNVKGFPKGAEVEAIKE